MNDDERIELVLRRFLAEAPTSRAPDQLRPEIASVTSRQRQRPHWLASLKEPPMHYRSKLAVGSPTLRLAAAMAVAAALLLFVTGAVIGGASLLPSPPVPTGAQNGLIAFDSNGDIMAAEPDGTNARVLVGGDATDTGPVWSPDGSQLAFWTQPGGSLLRSLAIADAHGQAIRTFGPPPGTTFMGYKDGHTNIDWGPGDGRIMVLTTGWDLYVLDLASGTWSRPDLVERTDDIVSSRQGWVNSFDWSDDGSRIAFVSWDDSPHYEYVYSWDMTDDNLTRLVTADPVSGSLASVDWDPSGRFIAYSKGLDDPEYTGSARQQERDRIDVYSFDVAGRAPTLIHEGKSYCPIWSADGTRIAFGDDQGEIWSTRADGSDLIDLGLTRGSCDMEWAPDGTRLVTMGDPGPEPSDVLKMIVFSADGTGTPVTIEAPGSVGKPSWQAIR